MCHVLCGLEKKRNNLKTWVRVFDVYGVFGYIMWNIWNDGSNTHMQTDTFLFGISIDNAVWAHNPEKFFFDFRLCAWHLSICNVDGEDDVKNDPIK